MRSREEIEKQVKGEDRSPDDYVDDWERSEIQIEVLLDIRDLLKEIHSELKDLGERVDNVGRGVWSK